MSKHNHKCVCEHENVSYCKTCKVCHCADCNQEWSVKGLAWQYYPYYQTYYTNGLGNTLSPQAGSLGLNQSISAGNTQSASTPVATVTACKHL